MNRFDRRDFLKASFSTAAAIAAGLNLPSAAKADKNKISCRDFQTSVSYSSKPWTNLNFYNDAKNFTFAIVSDRAGYFRPGVFNTAVDKLNLMLPEFVMSVGDLIDGNSGVTSVEMAQEKWDEFNYMVGRLRMPFFYVAGNHDHGYNDSLRQAWENNNGPKYYYFTYKNVLMLCLNTEEDNVDSMTDEQVRYFENVIKAHKDVRWTFLFFHNPLWMNKTPKPYWLKIESMLGDRNYTVFAGHIHNYTKTVKNGRNYYTLATTGGCGSGEGGNPSGPAKSEFDHFAWVTMTEKGPVIANIMLDGVLDDEGKA